jgi:hypothetical protein
MGQENHTAESIMELVRQLPIVDREKLHRLLTDMPEGTSELEEKWQLFCLRRPASWHS